MDSPLVELEIVDAVRRLTDALAVVAECGAAVNLRDGTLHQVALIAHELVARAISHRRYSGAEGAPSSRVPTGATTTSLLQITATTVIAATVVPVVALLVLPEVIIHAALAVWSAAGPSMRVPTIVVLLLVVLLVLMRGSLQLLLRMAAALAHAHVRLATVEVVMVAIAAGAAIIVVSGVVAVTVEASATVQMVLLPPMRAAVSIALVAVTMARLLAIVVIGSVRLILLLLLVAMLIVVLLLLHEHTIQLDVTVVHDEVLAHETLQVVAVYHVESAVLT